MSERNKSTQAIILSLKEQEENNWNVCALTQDEGIVYLTLYGGPKSKLRSLVQPFNAGTLYYYDDESRKRKKITDLDVSNFHPSFRESLFKMMASSLAAELIMKTHCAGDSKTSFILLRSLEEGMNLSSEDNARLGLLRFLWRYSGLLGVQPDPKYCCTCGEELCGGKDAGTFMEIHNGFLCKECASSYDKNNKWYVLSKDSLSYLAALNEKTPVEVRRIVLSAESFLELKRFLYHFAEHSAGCRLRTFESGSGIL